MATYDFSSPLESTFTSSTQSSSFRAAAHKPFNISIKGTFSATIALERSFDGGTTWWPVTYPDGTAITYTGAVSTNWEESEDEVFYRLKCTYTSGTVTFRLSQ